MGLFSRETLALPYARVVFPSEDAVRTGGDFDGPESLALRRLKPLVGRDLIGVPFGPGVGLEAALAVAAPLKHALPVHLRSMVAILEEEVSKRAVSLDDWDQVLGHNAAAMKRYGVGRETYASCIERLGRLKTDGREIADENGQGYDCWRADTDWAVEAWVWAAVIYQRLGNAGRVFLFE